MGHLFERATIQGRRRRAGVGILAALTLAVTGFLAVPAPVAQAAVMGDNYPAALSSPAQDAVVDPWNFYNRECTSFVAWRLNNTNKVDGFSNQYGGAALRWGNANTWGTSARAKGIRVDNLPAVGSVAWSTAGAAGHVAWVAAVLGNGKITIEEYNYRSDSTQERGRYNTRTTLASAWTGFIHVKDLNVWPPSDGTFVRVDGTPDVYRMAGGAPLYVSSWSSFGGAQPTQLINSSQFASLPVVPADGTYIRAQAGGQVFTVARGAPIYVSSWGSVGGEKAAVGVDDAAVVNAGSPGVWQHLQRWPMDGFLRGANSKRIFRVAASGHPYYISSWAPYGGAKPFVDVDDSSIDRCEHMNCDPWGSIDVATGTAGSFNVAGWAQDPNTTGPTKVHVYEDGVFQGEWSTGASRPDVDGVYHRGSNYGYNITVNAGPGPHLICTYAINSGVGSINTQLGCLTATVS